ncbi:hypothetical protein B0H19DRAFT_1235586 [Mycena capillaripes]|nr:hypothetical protein B0H19DRAFT_1235586 [Mycena capillaripes]
MYDKEADSERIQESSRRCMADRQHASCIWTPPLEGWFEEQRNQDVCQREIVMQYGIHNGEHKGLEGRKEGFVAVHASQCIVHIRGMFIPGKKLAEDAHLINTILAFVPLANTHLPLALFKVAFNIGAQTGEDSLSARMAGGRLVSVAGWPVGNSPTKTFLMGGNVGAGFTVRSTYGSTGSLEHFIPVSQFEWLLNACPEIQLNSRNRLQTSGHASRGLDVCVWDGQVASRSRSGFTFHPAPVDFRLRIRMDLLNAMNPHCADTGGYVRTQPSVLWYKTEWQMYSLASRGAARARLGKLAPRLQRWNSAPNSSIRKNFGHNLP